jgi:hypothetical protein
MCEGEIMDAETHEIREGVFPGKNRLPLDVRIVARLFYIAGGLAVLFGIFLCSGVIEPQKSFRAFFGAVVLTNGLTQGIYWLFDGLCYLLFDWGLRRGIRLVWWFLMISSACHLVYMALWFPGYPIGVTIGIALQVLFIAWLWFRKELYGVHLAGSHRSGAGE